MELVTMIKRASVSKFMHLANFLELIEGTLQPNCRASPVFLAYLRRRTAIELESGVPHFLLRAFSRSVKSEVAGVGSNFRSYFWSFLKYWTLIRECKGLRCVSQIVTSTLPVEKPIRVRVLFFQAMRYNNTQDKLIEFRFMFTWRKEKRVLAAGAPRLCAGSHLPFASRLWVSTALLFCFRTYSCNSLHSLYLHKRFYQAEFADPFPPPVASEVLLRHYIFVINNNAGTLI